MASFEPGEAEGLMVLELVGRHGGGDVDVVSIVLPGGAQEFEVMEVRRGYCEVDECMTVVVSMPWDQRGLVLAECDVLERA